MLFWTNTGSDTLQNDNCTATDLSYKPSKYDEQDMLGTANFFSFGEATSLGEGKLWIQTC